MADIKVNHSGGIDGSDALMGPKIKDNDLQKAAQQFEAIFLRNMLKEMRQTHVQQSCPTPRHWHCGDDRQTTLPSTQRIKVARRLKNCGFFAALNRQGC